MDSVYVFIDCGMTIEYFNDIVHPFCEEYFTPFYTLVTSRPKYARIIQKRNKNDVSFIANKWLSSLELVEDMTLNIKHLIIYSIIDLAKSYVGIQYVLAMLRIRNITLNIVGHPDTVHIHYILEWEPRFYYKRGMIVGR
jgi:hypothetical protein